MKILIAPDKFKGSLTAKEAAEAMFKGIKKGFAGNAEMLLCPLSDGGEGFIDTFSVKGDKKVFCKVQDPLGRKIQAPLLLMDGGKTVVLETAQILGLALLSIKERNALKTSSFGLGEAIKNALDLNCKKIIIGLGGSATSDGGIGMLAALGAEFITKSGKKALSFKGEDLENLAEIQTTFIDKRLQKIEIIVACDVQNNLYGKDGAALMFAKQKGADDIAVKKLEKGLQNYGNILENFQGENITKLKGVGAAGGIGVSLAFLGGRLCSGFDLVAEKNFLKEKILASDLVLTGEGRIDAQTIQGKVLAGLCLLAKKYKKPLLAFAGRIEKEAEELYKLGLTSMFSINNNEVSNGELLENAKEFLETKTERVARIIKAFMF